MQPQLRVHRDTHQQFFFQFITSDERMIFESVRFASGPLCAKAINELRSMRSLAAHTHKLEHDGSFSFIVTSKKQVILGSGKRHWSPSVRNVDIHQLAQELSGAVIVEDGLVGV